ncbi:hypothetical protein F4679DRAFT_222287 [Xylaria curta]|nr:hypothetical protein F4679DRAFT_222287 [Xylaria curta]
MLHPSNLMSFRKEALTKDPQFFADAEGCPTTVVGRGQRIYWQNAVILIYRTGHESEPIGREAEPCSGEATVPKGISLWFGREGGRVKEE